MPDDSQQLSANKQALLKIRALKQQIAELQSQQSAVSEPIAIVSMACRFPRASNTPEAFWQSLIDKTDQVSEIPDDRWDMAAFHDDNPEVPGKMYARSGAFLDNIDLMDPEFFGISPREATWVDPQQRLLMEVGWEALERAGWTPETIGDHTGIFVGWMHNDYQNEASDSFLNLNPYIATGAAGSFLCGRLAYYLGLQGPSVAVDTACSSSLVALHLACQSLQQRDCDRALVGGVNAICSPTTNILTCKLKALSPSGHSRAFDAAADGYLRGEGCGVVTIRRLADAEHDGDPILGVISGSAIGHNGFSSGLTAPNPKAQEKVIRQALERARLSPMDVAYLEAHGTGTALGDPIEMRAAAAALAAQRSPNNPLFVGSVKTNIGHLEAAAGMAGLLKVLLSIQHDRIPGQLNFEIPNPHIPWDKLAVKVLTETSPWPNADQRVAGVSAFGMSGTNAHVVITSHKPQHAQRRSGAHTTKIAGTTSIRSESRPAEAAPQIITLSGKTEEALTQLADRYQQCLRNDDSVSLANIAFTANTRRSHFEHRAAIVVNTQADAIDAFRNIARGGSSEVAFLGSGRQPSKVAWQFTGQGSQYVGMGRGLYESEAVFRAAIDHCDERLLEWRGESLTSVLFERNDTIDHTRWTQPAIFSVQMGLAKLLQSRGFQPDVVLGHSVGQYAAACVAGILSWDDGLKLISERGRLIGDLPPGGLMLAVFAKPDDVKRELDAANAGGDLSLAAMNGTHVVVSGTESCVTMIKQRFVERDIRCKVLATSHAFHSSLMDPALDPFRQFAETISFQKANVPLICNMSGKVLDANTVLTGQYWTEHIRKAVRYSQSIQTAQEIGCEVLLELGPQGTLTRMAAADWQKPANKLISCLHKDSDDVESLLQATGRVFVNGVTPDFESMYAGLDCHSVLLPTYPFQRRRFWGPNKPRASHAEFHTAHPLLGGRVSLAGVANETRFETFIELDSPPWLPDHEVMGNIVLPGAAYVEMAIAAAPGEQMTDVVFEQPLRPSGRTAVQTVIRTSDDGARTVESFSAPAGGNEWSRHFTARMVADDRDKAPSIDLAALKKSITEVAEPRDFYRKMREIGLNYGPQFQTITSLQYSQDAVLARLETQGDVRGFTIPPTLLDGALHSLAVGLLKEDDGSLFLPVAIDSVKSRQTITQDVWCHAKWVQNTGKQRTANLTLFSETGEVLAIINGLKVQQISRAALRQMSGTVAERLLYELQWRTYRLPAAKTGTKRWCVIAEPQNALAEKVRQSLATQGHSIVDIAFDGELDLRALGGDEEFAFDGIAWVLGTDARQHCDGILTLVHSLQNKGVTSIACGLQLITTDAIAVDEHSTCDPHQTKYWGLGRVIGAEQPDYRCRLIDVAATDLNTEESAGNAAAGVVDILQTETRDNQLAVRDSQFLTPRMMQVARSKKTSERFEAKATASYLITGGVGNLGRQAARWLADHGATQVILVSRRAPDDSAIAFIEEIEAAECRVIVHTADMTSRTDVSTLFQRFGDDLLPLNGVIHAAGILDDGLLTDQTWERFEGVLSPKIDAAQLLHEFTRELPLDFFVLYSSAASVLGSPGQSNYATGNAFLDGLAWQRTAAGLPATSINWGPWTEGMAADERIVKRLALQGITPLTVAEAHSAMELMLVGNVVQATVMDVDWQRMTMGLGGETPPMLEGLTPARQKSQMGDSAFVGQLKRLRGNAQKELLIKTVQATLQAILSTPDVPETDRPLIEMGLDSLMAVEFSTQLQMMLGEQFSIGPTMLFDHPTIDAIGAHVLEMVTSTAEDELSAEPPVVSTESPQLREREPIAIVGLSCRFPGARDVDEFWHNILNGVDSVCEIPPDRWNIDRFYDSDRAPGKMYTKQGGFIDDIADFDAAFFNISDQEACWIDPQHRMLLENSYRALEDAGISPHPLTDANVGVFMGIMGQDYAFLPQLDDEDLIKTFQGAGLSHSAGVGRISYVFGFEGPSIAVDTASSSSLVALYQAVRSLQDGNCNMALAGGVNAILAPVNSLLMSKAGLLSPDGRCKSFSAAADGFGRGEGCGVVVLKRLSDAKRDGDKVLAVVRGGAVVHNGFTGGITSPSGKSQTRVIKEALRDAKIAPSQVQYLEAHGTGTEFGDPMELGAAAAIYGKGRQREQPLLVGSVKGNISHLEAAGGISGLIKTVLSLHHGIIPPQANFDEPSPHIPWTRLPVKMVTEIMPWPETKERIAGLTALGLVGTNAHIVLSSLNTAQQPAEGNSENTSELDSVVLPAERTIHLLVLSARTNDRLAKVAKTYSDFLDDNPAVNLADLCHTAAVGRRHYEHRAALAFGSPEEVREKLVELAVENPSTSDVERTTSQPKLAWLLTGGDDSDLGAGRELYRAEPVFREFVNGLDERLKNHLENINRPDIGLREWFDSGFNDQGEETPNSDILLFALQSGLVQLWRSWGIEPDAVLGVGIGQLTAACVAGGVCFKDAATLLIQRQIALTATAASAEEEEEEEAARAMNEFESYADSLNYYPPNLQIIDSLNGAVVPVHRSLGGSYWRQHLTDSASPQSLNTLNDLNCNLILQIGPDAKLHGNQDTGQLSETSRLLPSLIAGQQAGSTMLQTLGELYVAGCNPDFKTFNAPWERRRISLPHYPFAKKRYWITEVAQHLETMEETISQG